MEVSGRRKEKDGDDHTTNILCDPCLGVNEEENAVFYCTVCNEFLCAVDGNAHRKAAISKAHQLLDSDSMPRQKIGSYEDTICPKHKGEILKYHCNSHSKNCCSVCTTMDHKHCEVEYMDDIAKGYEQSSEYKSLIKDMTELTRLLQSAKRDIPDKKRNSERLHAQIVSEIRKFRVEINSLLDSLENASLAEAEESLLVDRNAAELKTTSYDTLIAKLQEMTSSIENLCKYKQERQLVLHSKNTQAHVNKIKDEVLKLSDVNKRKFYKFIPDETTLQLLRSLKSLGRLEITEEKTKPKQNDERAKQVSGAEVLVPVINQPVTASHIRDINIEHSTDHYTHCWITGGVMIEHNKLALVDRNNGTVKVVDVISNTVISCIKLPTRPFDITHVEQQQVVVSCDKGNLVFMKVGTTLSIVKQLNLGGCVQGIVYTNNSLIVVFGSPDRCVKVIDLKGKTLKTFKTDAAGHLLFKSPFYIALSGDQNTILVSDWACNRVISIQMDGTVRGEYTDRNLTYPCGLAVDRNNNAYVVWCDSNSIHQLSIGCKPIRVLLDTTHEIVQPFMVTYCKKEHRLYVSYHSRTRKNYISVFQLK